LDALISTLEATGDRVAFVGTDTAGGRAAYRLNATLGSGFTDVYFIDTGTWLLTKWRGVRWENGKSVVNESVYRDYRPVNGVLLPFRIEERTRGQPGTQRIVIDSIKVNAPYPANIFTAPPAAPPSR
jgi:hypothetical protein